jgi:hypothetical protein
MRPFPSPPLVEAPNKQREVVARRVAIARRNGRRGGRPSAALGADQGQAAAALSNGLPPPGAAKPSDLRALARSHGAGAIAMLAAILNDPTAPLRARLSAAQALLDRGFAKPTQEADREAAAAEPIKIRRTFWVPGPDGPVQVG